MEQLYQDNKDDGLMVITVLTEDENGEVPDAADCEEWAEGYGATHPILADTSAFGDNAMDDGVGFPFSLLIDRGMTVYDTDSDTRSITESQMQALL